MSLTRLLLVLFTTCCLFGKGQTGPFSPLVGSNSNIIGTNAWNDAFAIIFNNGWPAYVTNKGITNYLAGTNFGFAIPSPASIDGIQLEIDRSTSSPTAVAVLNNWSTGMTKTISAGTSRYLLACIISENGLGPRNATAVTYGGQAMTLLSQAYCGAPAGFGNTIEYWALNEAGIAAASSNAFAITFNGVALLENWEALSSAVYQFVDQAVPVSAIQTFTSNGASNPKTLSPAIPTRLGGITAAAVTTGNNTTPAVAIGGSNTYVVNSGFTEVIDTYSANVAFSTSGGAFQISHKASAAAGSEAPAFTFNGTANRTTVIAVHLQSLREADHSVRLVKNGVVVGNNYAQTTAAWPTVDTYTSYGGATDLWGTTWTVADVNAANFGAVLSASVQNGTAQVDQFRITIYWTSTLPVELLDFSAEHRDGKNYLLWQTATELNNKEFVVERSLDLVSFEAIGTVKGHGNSKVFNNYEFIDEKKCRGNTYYRLKQIDLDGTFSYSKNIVLNAMNEDDFTVYPNPSDNGRFSILSTEPVNEGITIYNADLKLIKTVCTDPSELNFSLEELADGRYYLIYNQGGVQKIKQIQKSSRSN